MILIRSNLFNADTKGTEPSVRFKIKQVALKFHIIDVLEVLFLAHILPAILAAY